MRNITCFPILNAPTHGRRKSERLQFLRVRKSGFTVKQIWNAQKEMRRRWIGEKLLASAFGIITSLAVWKMSGKDHPSFSIWFIIICQGSKARGGRDLISQDLQPSKPPAALASRCWATWNNWKAVRSWKNTTGLWMHEPAIAFWRGDGKVMVMATKHLIPLFTGNL